MKIFCPNPYGLSGRGPLRRAFSLVEMLVAVGILAMIVTGLLAIFSVTSKALRRSNVQTDVLETGRMMMEMLTREVQQLPACNLAGNTNFNVNYFSRGLIQTNVGFGLWTNHIYDLFLLNRYNTNWQGIGYALDPVEKGYGTLYRFETNSDIDGVHNHWQMFYTNVNGLHFGTTNFPRVADGIVHFAMRVYDSDGKISWVTNFDRLIKNGPGNNDTLVFKNTEVPAFVEIELGIIEPQVLEQIKAMPVNRATNFLMSTRGSAATHLFRQLIPIRTIAK